jgi:GT2 family glycosyltransferase
MVPGLVDMKPRLVIAIVNYRGADLTIGCLRSLAAEVDDGDRFQVVVADNHSEDGSVERITAAIEAGGWQSWAGVLPLDTNGGYAFGNNSIIRQYLQRGEKPDYVLLLNPDTAIRPGAIGALVRFAELHREGGVFGSRLESEDGTVQQSAFRFHSILGEFDNALRLGLVSKLLRRWSGHPPPSLEPFRADWVAGASMLLRTRMLEEIGLLDEGYFLYFEEVDFCLRAARAGWSCWYVPSSRVMHLRGQSTGVTNWKTTRPRLPQYWFDSRRRYFLKNHGPLYALGVDCTWFVAHVLWELRRFLQGKREVDPPRILGDYTRNSVFVRGFRL